MELFKLFGTIAINNQEANDAMDETTGRAKDSQSKMGEAFKKIGTAVATYFAVDKIVDFGKAVIDLTASFEDAMLKVQSLSGASQEEYQQLSDAALEYGSTTAWTAKDVADAMGYMALAGFETSEILSSTSGMLSLASASGENLATVTDILTDSMTGFGDSADQASRYADVLATVQAKSNTTVGLLGEAFKYVSPLAGAYGYELEDVATALGLMANAGVKGSMAGTAMSSIMSRLATDAGATSKSLGALGTLTETCGVEFYNADGSTRNLSDVLKELCDATKDYTVEQKSEIAKTIAGQEAQKGLLAILNQGSSAYEDLRVQLVNCGGAASSMAENMESGLGGAIRNIQSAFEGFRIKLGQEFSEPIGNAIKMVADWINGTLSPSTEKISEVCGVVFGEISHWLNVASDWVYAHMPEIQSTITNLWEQVQFLWNTIGRPVFDLILSVSGTLRDTFAQYMPEIKEFVSQCFTDIISFWNNNLKPCLDAIGNFIENTLAPIFESAFNGWIVPAVETAFTYIKSLWNDVLKPVFTGITDFLTGVFTLNFEQALNGIQSFFKGIMNGILNGIETMINGAISSLNGLISGINKAISLAGSLLGLDVSIPTISTLKLPRLEEGGILEKGQVGLLEGNGAEAVVPLDKNKAWISAVAKDMNAAGLGGNNQQTQRIIDLLEMLVEMLPDTMTDAFASMKMEFNKREVARMVKAVN